LQTQSGPRKPETFEEEYINLDIKATFSNRLLWEQEKQICAEQRWIRQPHGYMGLCTGPATNQKAQMMLDMGHKIREAYAHLLNFLGVKGCSLSVPILLQQASREKKVNNPPQDEFCTHACTNCKLVVLDSLHGIWKEPPAIREPALKAAVAFLLE